MLQIRPIRETDIMAFRDAVGVVRAERTYILPGLPSPIGKTRAFVMANIEDGNPHFVADDDGTLCGWCDIVPVSDNEALTHVGRLGMALLPAWRDRRIGELLIRAALAAAKPRGFTRVQLEVFATNARARALYRKVGFVDEGVRRRYLRIDGQEIDEILMAYFPD